jgi:hypothetical protein
MDTIECFNPDFVDLNTADTGTRNRWFVLEHIIHSADTSNPCKTTPKFIKWTDMVINEFIQQGEREKWEGLEVSPLCDKDTINVANAQMGFMEFVVVPYYIGRFFIR